MKRHYACMVDHGNGTYSGAESIGTIEKMTIFRDSRFIFSDYYEMQQYELIELIFYNYAVDGVVARRIFDHCTFSFLGFTREQIDNVMWMLERRKKPSQVHYSFIHCKVVSDGIELVDYILRRDHETTLLLRNLPEVVRVAATMENIEMNYNLKEMTVFCELESSKFCQEHHEYMKRRRLEHVVLKKRRHEARIVAKQKKVTHSLSLS